MRNSLTEKSYYNLSMEKVFDCIAIELVCIAFMAMGAQSDLSVVGILLSISALGACLVLRISWLRGVLCVAFVAGCALLPFLSCFLPAAAYLCVSEKSWGVRLFWIFGLGTLAFVGDTSFAFITGILCLVASVLAVKTILSGEQKRGMKDARDGIREQMIGLAAKQGSPDPGEIEASIEALRESRREEAFDGLTERERAIAELVSEGLDNREIAAKLYLSEGTVRNNISSILTKKQLKNRTQLAVLLISG